MILYFILYGYWLRIPLANTCSFSCIKQPFREVAQGMHFTASETTFSFMLGICVDKAILRYSGR